MLYSEFARRRKQWTLQQLSQATRICMSSLSLMENGQFLPNADQLDRLSRMLEVPAELLLKEVVKYQDSSYAPAWAK